MFANATVAAGASHRSVTAVHPAPDGVADDLQLRVPVPLDPLETPRPALASVASTLAVVRRASRKWQSLPKPDRIKKLPNMVVLPAITAMVFGVLLTMILPAYLTVANTANWETSAITYPRGFSMPNIMDGREFGMVIRLQSINARTAQACMPPHIFHCCYEHPPSE